MQVKKIKLYLVVYWPGFTRHTIQSLLAVRQVNPSSSNHMVMKHSNPIAVYIALAYLISWLTFIALALNHHQIIFLFPDDAAHARLQDVLHAPGATGPVLAAVITLRLFYNKENRRQFINGYSVQKLNAKGWLLAFSPLLIFAFSLLVSRIINHDWADIAGFFVSNKLTNPLNLFAWLLPILFYGFGEEGGWRGYALPALQAKYPAFKATVILSIIWSCWHIPSFFYRYDLKGATYVGFLLGIFAGAIWLTFLFNYTKGSTLAVSLWHLTFNLVSMIGKDEMVLSAVMSVVIMLLGGLVLIKYKPEDLSPIKKTTLQTGVQERDTPAGEKEQVNVNLVNKQTKPA
jgi:membrane protease YdiL (CAAX protease family)